MKRAAIYVRVSTERQADRVSPKTQEADSRAYCEVHNYQVFDIYRDIEKYKSNGRMVEPSGTRADRPQLKRMLADGDAGQFDVVIAWREDRLYRGVNRAMLELSERVKSKVFSIELVKEFYDPGVAVVKAWAAGIELEAKHDRSMMGMAGWLAKGKAWCPTPPFGYRIGAERDKFLIDDTEAECVQYIFKNYASGVSLQDIRRELIRSGISQRRKKLKYAWNPYLLRRMLHYDFYFTGIFSLEWDGKRYEIMIPPIIDGTTYQDVKNRLAKFHAYPATHLKLHALAAGKIYCSACGARIVVRQTTRKGKKYLYYQCWNYGERLQKPGCAHSLCMKDFDEKLWQRVWNHISVPGVFEKSIRDKVEKYLFSVQSCLKKGSNGW